MALSATAMKTLAPSFVGTPCPCISKTSCTQPARALAVRASQREETVPRLQNVGRALTAGALAVAFTLQSAPAFAEPSYQPAPMMEIAESQAVTKQAIAERFEETDAIKEQGQAVLFPPIVIGLAAVTIFGTAGFLSTLFGPTNKN